MRKERSECQGRKGYAEVDLDLIKRIRSLRRKPRGVLKRMPFGEISDVLHKEGYQSRTSRPLTAQGVAMIMSRVSR